MVIIEISLKGTCKPSFYNCSTILITSLASS